MTQPPAVPPLDPPDDPDDWTHEQWCDWLQALEDEPEPVRRPRRRGFSGGSMLGAAMMGLDLDDDLGLGHPAVDDLVEADGQDDGLVLLDPDDPAESVITVPRG